ncbi:asparagine--tRNA ligase [Candidatus Gracilibacteria bacterium]|nr:asparagine--tRNA ligase [Candidatus Gracilibacteria bacterium]MCF7819362.1 asparagine--tRNA ligase [Candidatus Gracilibacteria bacterium]
MRMVNIHTLFRNPQEHLDQTIQLQGWIRTVRSSKNLGFLQLHDGTFFKSLQVVFESDIKNFEKICHFPIGSAVSLTGKFVESQGAGQDFEIQATSIELIADSDPSFPLQKKRHSFEYLRTIAHVRPRSNTFQAVFRLRSELAFAIHKFFHDQGFVHVHTPIISSSDCEGAGEMFQVTTLDLQNLPKTKEKAVDFDQDFFAKKTGLTVSGQLQGEAFALAFQKIYTFGPTFRAENSNTSRHVAEFWMMEPEIAFADVYDNMDLAEDMMKYVIHYVLEKLPEEMEFFNTFIDKGVLDRLKNIVDSKFERITYTEAIEILEKSGEKFEFPVTWGIDLQSEHEQYVCKHFGKPVFVTGYPKDIKAFYMRLNDDGKTVAAMDLLVPGVGEIMGGAQREERLDVLDKRIDEMGLKKEDYWWYRELRKYGGVPHAGFGLGFERLIQYVSGMGNIRDVIPFPRTPRNAEF